ncbi:MAG: hypothetical protein MI867_28165 [Pseudomonadales bacterium]|nr:hypothetical protein [Pseudomonadales bacterium]
MNRLADITIKSLLSSGFALGLALLSLLSTAAKADDWTYSTNDSGIDSFRTANVTPLMTFQVSAGTGQWNNDTLDISASFRGVALSANSKALSYAEVSKDFNVSSPIRALDFTDAIRARTEICVEKVIEKMVIDGAVGFNLNW